MDDEIARFVNNLVGRIYGPMHFRIIMQPLMATLFAFLDGRRDAAAGRTPYIVSLLTEPQHRSHLLRGSWKSAGRVFLMAFLIDVIYQGWILRWFYPLEALTTAVVLAFVPYLLLRGIFCRILSRVKPKA